MAIITGNRIQIESTDSGKTIALANFDYVVLNEIMTDEFKIRFVRVSDSPKPNRLTSSIGIRGIGDNLKVSSLVLLENTNDSIELMYDVLNSTYQVVAFRNTSLVRLVGEVTNLANTVNSIVDGAVLFQVELAGGSDHVHSAVLPIELARELIERIGADYQYIQTNIADGHQHFLMVRFDHTQHRFYVDFVTDNETDNHQAWVVNGSDDKITIKNTISDYTVAGIDSYRTLLRVTSPNPVTIYLPQDDGSIPVGACILISKSGSGDVTIAGLNQSVALNSPLSNIINRMHGKVTVIKVGPDEWDLEGNLMA
jgi:hypothetical protein